MHITDWDNLREQLRAALITTYPMFAWRAELFADKGDPAPNEHAGIAVRARRGAVEHEVRIPAQVISQARFADLVQQIYVEAADGLAQREHRQRTEHADEASDVADVVGQH